MNRTPLRIAVPLSVCLIAACSGGRSSAPDAPPAPIHNDSGGVLPPEQAAYDVRHYDLSVEVDPVERAIEGRVGITAEAVAPTSVLLLDLDERLTVRRVSEGADAPEDERDLAFEHRAGRLRIQLGRLHAPGETFVVTVAYGGQPRTAPRPPWEGGFTWSETKDGEPWIATSNQGEGADLWWPCKDHPSDEPDSMDIRATVPRDLVCVSNGKLVSIEKANGKRRTYHWRVSTPISNYTVALNIAPYVTVEATYASISGDEVAVTYWVLPENLEQGQALMTQILAHLRFMEQRFGPYPFRADKYGVVETPHLGMEHQTVIAYGNQYRDNEYGYDWLHHHELAHEWWANLVTAPDWNDFWIHEGFGTYAQNLYVEELRGADAYRESMAKNRARILNLRAVAPREPRSSGEMYFIDRTAPDGERKSDTDIYYKGAWVLHTLRYLVGDDTFATILRRFAYPDPALEQVTDGSQCRFATTDDFLATCEQQTGMELDWFFEAYLRQPELPRLVVERWDDRIDLSWLVPEGFAFPMPVEVRVGERTLRVPMPEGKASLPLPPEAQFTVDPSAWILRAADEPSTRS